MSDPPDVISIPKATGTHADVLAAVGLADLLSDPAGRSARIRDSTEGFAVIAPAVLDEAFFTRLPIGPGYPYLRANLKADVPSGISNSVDYPAERERFNQYRELLKQTKDPTQRRDPLLAERLEQHRPRPDWRLLQVLNAMQGHKNSNQVHTATIGADQSRWRNWVREGVRAIAAGSRASPPWKAKLVQLFTPNAAKGYARLKPDSTQRGDSTKEQWGDPFLEWLKYRGYFRVACPYFIGNKGEHIRLLCPVPADVSATALADVASELRRAPVRGGPAKLDCLAVLYLARLLIEHSVEYHEADVPGFEGLELLGKSPAEVVSGVTVTHYQSLGSARVVATLDTLAVPNWFPIAGPERAGAWLECLDEHRRVVQGLREDRSDEIGLLLQYRRFLERRGDLALWALLEFMGAYGQFLIRAREHKRRVPAFTTRNFREVVMGLQPVYTGILDDPGFKAVAAAVRRATVSAQALKAMGKDYRVIRYDLLPELRRKRVLSDSGPFIEVVSEFVSEYNVENARRREQGKPAHANVTTEEFAAFCRQVELHGCSLVGALLCAYGSCREKQDVTGDVEGTEESGGPDDGADASEEEEE